MSENLLHRLSETFVALEGDGGARPLPVTDAFWFDLASGRLGSFSRLVSLLAVTDDWTTWEMHPQGEEFVLVLDGDIELILERDGEESAVRLNDPGAYVLIPRGTWHTATVHRSGRVLFVTPGEGTAHRPR